MHGHHFLHVQRTSKLIGSCTLWLLSVTCDACMPAQLTSTFSTSPAHGLNVLIAANGQSKGEGKRSVNMGLWPFYPYVLRNTRPMTTNSATNVLFIYIFYFVVAQKNIYYFCFVKMVYLIEKSCRNMQP